jgi:hypothetical protein
MLILFPAEPFQPKRVDPDYARERDAADAAGLGSAFIDFEALLDGDADRAVRRVPESANTSALYRGWMLRPETYSLLFGSLAERGIRLITDPDAYRRTHFLPGWHEAMRAVTPSSVWTTQAHPSGSELATLLEGFGDRPVIIKDFVKSRKHEWNEAFYIPSAADTGHALQVTETFVQRQGEDLAGGLVYREYIPLSTVGVHPRSGIPLSREYRAFIGNGKLLLSTDYWDEGSYGGDVPPFEEFLPLAADLSPFLSMDVALAADGRWIVVEVGDGQVSGLAENADAGEMYAALASAFANA